MENYILMSERAIKICFETKYLNQETILYAKNWVELTLVNVNVGIRNLSNVS